MLAVHTMIGRLIPGRGPRRRPSRRAGISDGRQRCRCLRGQGTNQPRHRRIRSHCTKYLWGSAQQADIGQTVTTHGQRDRQITDDLARIMAGQRFTPRCQRRRQRGHQTRGLSRARQRDRTRVRHNTRPAGLNTQQRVGRRRLLHQIGAPILADIQTSAIRIIPVQSTFLRQRHTAKDRLP